MYCNALWFDKHHKWGKYAHISICVSVRGVTIPLADSFLVLMIFAAYSCPDDFFTHLRTTEKAPLRKKAHQQPKISSITHAPSHTYTHSMTFETASLLWQWFVFVYADILGLTLSLSNIHTL